MNKETLLTLKGNTVIGKRTKVENVEFSIMDLIALTDLIANGLYESRYDFNNDGVLDTKDNLILRKIRLGTIDGNTVVTIKQHIILGIYDEQYDINGDGVIDNADIVAYTGVS